MLAGLANQFSVKRGSLKKEVILHKNPKWKSAQFRVGVLQPPLGIGFLMVLRIFSFGVETGTQDKTINAFQYIVQTYVKNWQEFFLCCPIQRCTLLFVRPVPRNRQKNYEKKTSQTASWFLLQRTCAEKKRPTHRGLQILETIFS